MKKGDVEFVTVNAASAMAFPLASVPGVVTVTVMSPPDPLITESQVRPFEQSTVCGPLAAVAYVGLVPADAEMV